MQMYWKMLINSRNEQINGFYIFGLLQIKTKSMSFFGVQLNSQVNKLLFEIRLQLARNKYVPNIRTIYRSFVQYDRQVSGIIRSFNFEHAMNANGIFFKKYELQVFQKAFNEQGNINWFTFLSHLKEPMGPLRRELVQNIFDSMDKEKKGSITVAELMDHFNVSLIQSYRLGKKTLQEAQDQFLSMLSIKDGEVTREEFIAYYDDANINFPHNDVFFRFVGSQWHYTPQKKQAVKEDQIKIVMKNLRYKLIEKSQGTKDELLVRKLFNDYDKNNNFYLTPNDTNLMVKGFNIQADPATIEAIHERIDKNNSGYIELQEFKKFLYYDPYPY